MENQIGSEPQVSLRQFRISDLDDFMIWASDNRVTRYCIWDSYTSRNDGQKYLEEIAIPHPWNKAICLNDRAIGSIGVERGSDHHRCTGQIGYVLANAYWGKGIGTQAVKMAVSSIFEEWKDLQRLEALVDLENVGSQKVLEKAGFKREGVLRKYIFLKGAIRDIVIFSILPSDPIF